MSNTSAPVQMRDGKVCSPEEIGNKLVELGLTAIGSHVYFDPYTSTHEDMVKIVEDKR